MNNIGQKLKYFRKRAGVSQLDLEVAIDAAPGSISRIESGQVNPTKETLLKIAKELGIKHFELSLLLGILPAEITLKEIETLREAVNEYMDSDVLAYVVDKVGTIYDISRGFVETLGLDQAEAAGLLGQNSMLMGLDPNTPFGKIVDPEYVGRTVAQELKRMQLSTDITGSEFYQQLIETPLFPLVEKELSKVTKKELYAAAEHTVHIILNGKKLKFFFAIEVFWPDPRFDIVEYINPQEY